MADASDRLRYVLDGLPFRSTGRQLVPRADGAERDNAQRTSGSARTALWEPDRRDHRRRWRPPPITPARAVRITGRAGPHRLRMDPCRVWGHRGEGSPSAWKRQPTPVDAISECWSGCVLGGQVGPVGGSGRGPVHPVRRTSRTAGASAGRAAPRVGGQGRGPPVTRSPPSGVGCGIRSCWPTGTSRSPGPTSERAAGTSGSPGRGQRRTPPRADRSGHRPVAQ